MKKQVLVIRIGLLFSLTLSMLGTARPASAAGLSVCQYSSACYSTIAAAVAAASDGDTITIGAGTYTEHDITVAKNITINGVGAGVVVVNGNNLGGIFTFNSGVTASISGMTIRNGYTNSGGGGGIYNNGTLSITNSSFSGNSANSGGGIANAGTLTVANSTFSGNSATNNGGGIANAGTLTVTNSTFSGNSASGAGGGGIDNTGTLTVTKSTFAGNSSVGGGGGGGINNAGTLTVSNSTFSDNSAKYGGGIYIFGILLNITNSTFYGNSATNGGGIYASAGSVILRNTIVAANTGGNCGSSGSNIILNGGENLEDGTTCGWGAASGSMSSTDPLLGALANNGGPTQTMALLPGSPAIDAGNAATCTVAPVSNVDQRGFTRLQDALCDIGAYEASTYPLTITSANGTVARNPDKVFYHEGDVVQLTAMPATGWAFDNWTGALTGSANPGSVTIIHGENSVTANYSILSNLTLTSVAAQDGWVLESSENSNKGGFFNSNATTFYLGDDAAKRQYRAILSFNTGTKLPATAVITGATLKVKKQAILGGVNPLTTFKGLMVDIKNGVYGTAALKAGDFQAAASQSLGPFKPVPAGNWYSIDLAAASGSINTSGLTQIRLRFKWDDNNNAVANILRLYSGNTPTAAYRPQLIITYYVP